MSKEHKIDFYGIKIALNKKEMKSLRLKIYKNGEVKLSVPLQTTKQQITEFLEANKTWLIDNLNKIPSPNSIKFLGKRYEIYFDENTEKLEILNGKIKAKNLDEFEKFSTILLKKICQKAIIKYSNLIQKYPTKIRYKYMTSRYGSCNHKKGYINLSLNLYQKHYKFINYVVLHEISHLIFPHHQKSFYDLIEKFMPDYKNIIKKFEN